MNKLIREIELPQVSESDPRVIDKIAELLGDFVDFEIPGFGITHELGGIDNSKEAHRHHGLLILQAVSIVRPPINTAKTFESQRQQLNRRMTPMHDDVKGILPAVWQEIKTLKMFVTLHTADADNGATVSLANTAAGLATSPGDREFYDAKGEPNDIVYDLGYEGRSLGWGFELLGYADFGQYDPLMMDGYIFKFSQTPLSSIVFRGVTDLGPSTVHGFKSFDPQVGRDPYTSVLSVNAY